MEPECSLSESSEEDDDESEDPDRLEVDSVKDVFFTTTGESLPSEITQTTMKLYKDHLFFQFRRI